MTCTSAAFERVVVHGAACRKDPKPDEVVVMVDRACAAGVARTVRRDSMRPAEEVTSVEDGPVVREGEREERTRFEFVVKLLWKSIDGP